MAKQATYKSVLIDVDGSVADYKPIEIIVNSNKQRKPIKKCNRSSRNFQMFEEEDEDLIKIE
jgi:hypothetical protein